MNITMEGINSITLFLFLFLYGGVAADGESSKSLVAVFHPERFEPFIRRSNDKEFNFDREWERNRTWVLANMAHAAYHNSDYIDSLMSKFGARLFRFYEKKGAEAFLTVWKDKAVLAFRGTQTPSLNDLIADIWIFPKKVGSASVHRGFSRELDKLWNEISEDLQSLIVNQNPVIPVWATGHSLGGAMATLAGMRFGFQEVVTFGEPRVGRNIESMFLAKAHTRYVNGDDPVPKLGWFKHHGTEILIRDADGPTDWRYDHAIIYYSESLF